MWIILIFYILTKLIDFLSELFTCITEPEIMSEPTECPVCMREFSRDEYILRDGMENRIPNDTGCCHWFCCDCIVEMKKNELHNCPLCRRNIAQLFDNYCDCGCDCDSDSDSDEDE